jgi:hypothetical protein
MRLSLQHVVAAALSVGLPGCSLIDDFDKFRIREDLGDDDAGQAGDAATGNDASEPCGVEDCSSLDSDCARGECRGGQCVAAPIPDGRPCGDDKCAVCKAGSCGAPKDCSAYDGACARGECNPADGSCMAVDANEDQPCFDNDPCTVDELCSAGRCTGAEKDCSTLDDQCSEGVCEATSGKCVYGTPSASKACDDFNPCTTNDQCDASGLCIATKSAPAGDVCTDYNPCTGTAGLRDACDGLGDCLPGAPVLAGTECDDDNECTGPDTCSGTGSCAGASVREGQACETACKTDNTCQAGTCLDEDGQALGYKPGCYFNWCDGESACQDRWRRDGACDCGCDFVDADCDACSARMCEPNAVLQHRAAKWCDGKGDAIAFCPESLKNDGKCDCGCQFADPDCGGGACCSPTDKAGCGDAFIEDCVCDRGGATDAAPECCNQAWDERCATLAVQLGCMLCE